MQDNRNYRNCVAFKDNLKQFMQYLGTTESNNLEWEDAEKFNSQKNALEQKAQEFDEKMEGIGGFEEGLKRYYEAVGNKLNAALDMYRGDGWTPGLYRSKHFIQRVSRYNSSLYRIFKAGVYTAEFDQISEIVREVELSLSTINVRHSEDLDPDEKNKLSTLISSYHDILLMHMNTNMEQLAEEYAEKFAELDKKMMKINQSNKTLNTIIGAMQFVNDLIGSVLEIADIIIPFA